LGGYHFSLNQFAYITDFFLSVCYQQSSPDQVKAYEQEIAEQGRMNCSLNRMLDTLLQRESSTDFGEEHLQAVPSGRFQILEVDENISKL
jgi:hypothetical protein